MTISRITRLIYEKIDIFHKPNQAWMGINQHGCGTSHTMPFLPVLSQACGEFYTRQNVFRRALKKSHQLVKVQAFECQLYLLHFNNLLTTSYYILLSVELMTKCSKKIFFYSFNHIFCSIILLITYGALIFLMLTLKSLVVTEYNQSLCSRLYFSLNQCHSKSKTMYIRPWWWLHNNT